jgi:ABC-type Mn2+/Zn2+ transport system ATPase subunit
MEAVLEARELSYTYPATGVSALRGLAFSLPRGGFCAVIGPNGSGKTTLVRLVMGLLRPSGGEVTVLGRTPWREPELVQRLLGYVPQRDSVNSAVPLSVREVVSLAASTRTGLAGGAAQVRQRVEGALAMVDLADLRRRPYASLSGGQQQRVLIARALAVDPHVLVLDEPFAGVDAGSESSIAELLHRLTKQHGVTVFAVVHNVNPLVHYMDHALLLRTQQVAFGEPAAVLTASNLQAAYGATVPIMICAEGYRHPVMQTTHE